MKTLIAVPCMSTVPTRFLRCLESLQRRPDTYTSITECTLIHDARNEFAGIAIQNEFDRVLWLDSDMVFPGDLLIRMSSEMDELAEGDKAGTGRMLTTLFFKRVKPTEPVIWSKLETDTDPRVGEYVKPTVYENYPRDAVFPVAACGFGAVMTDVSLLKAVWDKYGPPFSYYRNLGEDLSFCWRVQELGGTIWCDSRIKVGHLGYAVFDEGVWDAQNQVF